MRKIEVFEFEEGNYILTLRYTVGEEVLEVEVKNATEEGDADVTESQGIILPTTNLDEMIGALQKIKALLPTGKKISTEAK